MYFSCKNYSHLWKQIQHQEEETMQPVRMKNMNMFRPWHKASDDYEAKFDTFKDTSCNDSPIHQQDKKGDFEPKQDQGGG